MCKKNKKMNHFALKIDTNKMIKAIALVVFMVISNVAAFGQSTSDVADINTVEANVAKNDVSNSASTSINFVLWFMGSKQDPNTSISSDRTNTKKQIMTSGIAPNRLLIKAFLKKAVDSENSLA
jgi:hypothetical protein